MAGFDLKDAGKALDQLGAKMHQAAIKGLHSAALRGVQVIVAQIIPSRSPQPVDRGIYKAGWKPVLEMDGAAIENLETHAVFIEHGVRGGNVKIGQAMISALAEWVVRKKIADRKEAVSAAWAIAKAMKRRGIFNGGQGMGILKEFVDKHAKRIIGDEVRREVAKLGA